MSAAGRDLLTDGRAPRDLAPLLRPRSVAVIGASDDTTGIRGRLMAQLLKGGFGGTVVPINLTRPTIQGLRAYAAIAEAPGPIDLALIAIPAANVPDTLRDCAAAGVRAAVVYSAGFAEEGGEDNAALQAQVREIARAKNMIVAGPNLVGFLNVAHGLAATFSPAVDFAALDRLRADTRPRIAIVSQSGGLGFALFNRGVDRRLPFSYVINTGNEADLDATEVAEFLVDDASTKVVLLFLESIRQGRRFMALAERALAAQKPLIVAKIGRSAAGQRAASSHTASLTGSDRVYDAVFRRYGVLRADDQDEMLDVAAACALMPTAAGRRVGVITISGGVGGWMSDTLEGHGLSVPLFSDALQARVRDFLPSFGAAFNPIDITAQAIGTDWRLQSIAALCASDEVDAIVNISSLAADSRLAAEKAEIAKHVKASGKPLLFYSYPLPSDAARADLAEIGIPLYTSLAGAAGAVRALADLGAARQLAAEPAPAMPAGDRAAAVRALDAAGATLCEYEAKAVLAAYGIAAPPERLARDRAEAVAAASALGYPVVLKLQSPDLPHKSDVGGVALGLADDGAVVAAYDAMIARAPKTARLHGVLVQRMAAPGLEMIAGIARDPDFGPQLMVGFGGIHVEVLDDTALTPVPLSPIQADRLLDRLRGAKLLGPLRGAPARDRAALVELLVRLSVLAADLPERIVEIDLNPVFVHEAGRGLTIVDALIVQRQEET